MFIQLGGVNYYAYTASHQPRQQQETVLFVHGAAMDHSVWALQSRYFAYHGYNILALDLPGHGQSGDPARESIADYARWLVDIMQHSTGCGFHLAGHSMGALICLEAAAMYSGSVASLSLAGFSWPMSVAPGLMEAARDRPSDAYAMMTQWSHASVIGGEPNPGFWSAGSQLSMMENSRPGVIHADLTACDAYQGAEQAFDNLTCPILFVSGVLDKMAPCKLARQHADNHANAQIVTLPNCGHSLLSEKPDEVRDTLFAFISSHPCPASTD